MAALLLVTLGIGCTGILDNSQTGGDIAVETQLQHGFAAHWVSVELNHEIRYEAFLNADAPATRPLVRLVPESPRESHHLFIRWVPINGNIPAGSYERRLSLDQSRSYEIGIDARGNTIQVIIQSSPIGHV